MKNVLYLSDFLSSEVVGGAELNDEEFIRQLGEKFVIKSLKCSVVKHEDIKNSDFIILSNFVTLSPFLLEYISDYKKYILYEHDHKYLKRRQPNLFENFIAPKDEIVNEKLYRNAIKVYVQSSFHEKIINDNLQLNNVYNVSGNFWSKEILSYLSTLSKEKKDLDIISIMDSSISHKNTLGSISVCKKLNKKYKLIKGEYKKFLADMSGTGTFLFIPSTPETLSRVVVEAKLAGCRVMTNSMIGATYEPWFVLNSEQLFKYLTIRMKEVIEYTSEIINENCD